MSSSTSLGLLPSSSKRRSISTPVSPRFSWFYQEPCCDVEFSPNASFAPRGLVAIDCAGRHDRGPGSEHQKDAAGSSLEGIERERKAIGIMMNLDGTHLDSYKVIRSRPIRSFRNYHRRAFHTDQTYSPLSFQTSPSWNPEELLLGLPQLTSPARPKRFRRKRTWLLSCGSCFRLVRLRSGPAICLSLYFGFNLGLTLYNKSLLIHFPFPYTLSAIHALCGSIGCIALTRAGSSPPPRLNFRETLILLAFSVLYTINIVVSNVSLDLVTVPVSHSPGL